ncbi:MAG TPA: pyridoxine 5'-phosphate synthase [Vicinamibacterales bacterium]|nr:pyridoxine 5'-phosphate synthase [Vicinamibacterales bacterium]
MRLAVNIDHIATLREARKAREPEPLAAAFAAEMAGAKGITVHLRSDRRHIKERDLEILRQAIATKLNVEMAVTADMARVALQVRPDQVTLVPERPQELTTEGGLNVVAQSGAVKDFTKQMQDAGIRVSIFLDPDADQVRGAKSVGADAVEINTGRYAESVSTVDAELKRIKDAAALAARHDLEVLAGHGLNYTNVQAITAIPEIVELNIGHSIVARAAIVGMDRAVRDMVALLELRR